VKELFQTIVETNATLAKAWTTCFRYNNYNVDLRHPGLHGYVERGLSSAVKGLVVPYT
jgi:hypothetical protein